MKVRKINNFLDKLFELKIFNIKFIPILMALVIISLSIGYSALNENIFAELSVAYEPQSDIRITDISYLESSDEDTIDNSKTYVKDSVSISSTMPNSDSYIIYNVSITNFGNVKEGILNITSSNENIKVETIDYTMGDPLCESSDFCTLGASVIVKVKVSYDTGKYELMDSSNGYAIASTLSFDFRGYHSITYSNITLNNKITEIIEGANIVIDLEDNEYDDYSVSPTSEDITYSYDGSTNKLSINNITSDITIKGLETYLVSYTNININNLNSEAIEEKSFSVTLSEDIGSEFLEISMNGVTLTSDDYTYTDAYLLTINNVNGNITIKNIDTSNSVNIANLDSNLVPVIYDDTNSKWKIVSSSNEDDEWYDYGDKRWANAVILASGVDTTVGTLLDDSTDILAFFVYIPRFEYKIEGDYGYGGTDSLPGRIDVNFISSEVTTSTTGYIIHPAFTFGEDNISGMWVGKFELSHITLSESTTVNNLECTSSSCENVSGIRIIPNVNALTYNNISNFYYAIKNLNTVYNITGDTHMIKNSEWSAVAYLSQSLYGKYGNSNYSDKKISQNKTIITGNSSSSCTYNSATDNCGIGASTTGNIYGIYDMNGGTYEYTMGVFNSSLSSSGFTSLPDLKYYDLYLSDNEYLGHGLSETNGWSGDSIVCETDSLSWYTRGGSMNSTNSGIFAINCSNGNTYDNSSRAIFIDN